MSLETSVLKLCVAVSRGADRGLSERMTSCIKSYSWWGAVIMALPLFGLDTLIYAIVLWSMYGKISSLSGVPFSGHAMKNILGGFIVNILIVFVLNMVLDFILVFGWIGSAIVGYWGTKLSGQAYVEVLVQLHGRGNVREHMDYNAFMDGFKGKQPEDRNRLLEESRRAQEQRLLKDGYQTSNEGGWWQEWISTPPPIPSQRIKDKRSKD